MVRCASSWVSLALTELLVSGRTVLHFFGGDFHLDAGMTEGGDVHIGGVLGVSPIGSALEGPCVQVACHDLVRGIMKFGSAVYMACVERGFGSEEIDRLGKGLRR